MISLSYLAKGNFKQPEELEANDCQATWSEHNIHEQQNQSPSEPQPQILTLDTHRAMRPQPGSQS